MKPVLKHLFTYCLFALVAFAFAADAQAKPAMRGDIGFQVLEIDKLDLEISCNQLVENSEATQQQQDIESESTDNDDEQECFSYLPNWLIPSSNKHFKLQLLPPYWLIFKLVDPPAAKG